MKRLKKFNKYATNIKEDIVNELHKPARINFKRRRTVIKGLNDLIQADLIDLISYSKENNGYKKIRLSNPTTYLLQNEAGKEITGGFYELELQKVKHPNAHLVEKVLRKKGNKVFVKRLGYNDKHNSWIDSNNVL
ncbi:hypothetical protein NQ315_012416 [Exocentrus adspersus]|uniref:Chromo domain-containing protein n=1 Tax=Exocentrus adspersus TaxID=1586481 RepID=A0AAV8VMT3_9CUCU|nr:hypothetical protein NQ315_012416 [Exocentrus adspersus]